MKVHILALLIFVCWAGLFGPALTQAHYIEGSPEFLRVKEAEARLPQVSLLPDSFFYFLKTIKETIQGFFVFSLAAKIEFEITKANTRIAELLALVHKNQAPYIKEALERERKTLNKIANLMIRAQEKGIDVASLREKHELLLNDHLIIFLNVEDDIPADAKDVHFQIMETIVQTLDQLGYKREYEIILWPPRAEEEAKPVPEEGVHEEHEHLPEKPKHTY